ncbi:AAA family ATPase [Agrobacterium sp. CNPSo 3708]|uniref:ATP-dependent nuclease n=1 Tax=Agrobacterium sp. CNPSo 3708 TaxID=3028150 RepID=UPI002364022D|nr:AAA family ATPase [Agrobacterium sp. CNPSo 3708]MDD1499829.1 AAA family ATPase [Agrobacterium sp. CNPSo 3708]
MNVTNSENLDFFPKSATLSLRTGQTSSAALEFTFTLNSGLTVLLGPNGSGKTHILRALKETLPQFAQGKHTRFISAGRIGTTEQYRSIHNIYGGTIQYEQASFGSYDQRASRHILETLEGDYQNIAERPDIQLKIRERLKKLFRRDISLRWNNGSLKAEFSSDSSRGAPYSAAREASGLLHLVGLLSAIYDDKTGVLLLDEPEVSLHPQLQAFLLRETMGVAGAPGLGNKKIVVISTHSTEFLKIDHPNDLANIVFTSSVTTPPTQIPATTPELKSRKVAELISRMGQEHKLSFFANSPLLVEGPSDSIICSGLCSKLGIHIEAGGSQILPVVGKGQFPVVVKLLKLMGKTPIVLADADAFTDGNDLVLAFSDSEPANEAAVSMSHESLIKLYTVTQTSFTQLLESSWSVIQPLAEDTLYWKKKKDDDNETLLRRRSAFSAMFANDVAVLPPEFKTMRVRLAKVLDALEAGGCFILRKGTIESYYETDVEDLDGKPGAATEEVITFKENSASAVKEQYADVVRCLSRAAQTEIIDEAEQVRDAIITILAPIVAKLRDNPDIDISRLLMTMHHPFSSLFDISQENGYLIVNMRSEILDIDCFPLKINPADDPITSVSRLIRGE